MSDKTKLNADERFFELAELSGLSLEDLQLLWDSVPTEEQAYLVRVFDREAEKRQVVEDIDEAKMAQHFLEQYDQIGFVPAGDVWVKVPPLARQQYKTSLTMTASNEDADDASHENSPQKKATKKEGLPKWMIFMAVPLACLMVFAILRVVGGSNSRSAQTKMITPSPTPSPTPTVMPTLTPTPLAPTATPFNLSGFDDTIRSGDRASRNYYPVQLQVFANRQAVPRVYIVQQQQIGVAEWDFDPNPDVVSWLSGMIIRPVLGVPFNDANFDLFRELNADSIFVVTMNTGDVLQFVYEDTQRVSRADTALFQQNTPGLVLVLIGQTFSDGSPTDLRDVVRTKYPTDQELGRIQVLSQPTIPMGVAHSVGDVQITVGQAQWLRTPDLPSDLAYAVVDVQMVTADVPVSMDGLTWQFELNNALGERYAIDQSASHLGNCAPLSGIIPPNTSACSSIGFLVSPSANDARLLIGTTSDDVTPFELNLTPLPTVILPSSLDVQLGRMTYTSNALTVSARLYNPTDSLIPIGTTDFSLVLGFVPNPTGNAMFPMIENKTLAPDTSLDISLSFPYSGEGYAMLTILGRVWGVMVK